MTKPGLAIAQALDGRIEGLADQMTLTKERVDLRVSISLELLTDLDDPLALVDPEGAVFLVG